MRVLLAAFLALAGCLHQARADEPRTFGGKTVEGWLAVLRTKTSTEDEQKRAIRALCLFGPEAKVAAPDLIAGVHEGKHKEGAVAALIEIGEGAEVTVAPMIERFIKAGCQHRTGQGALFHNATTELALAKIGGPAVAALVDVLNGPDWDMRVLRRGGPGGDRARRTGGRPVSHSSDRASGSGTRRGNPQPSRRLRSG